jgi:hypothetical protein
VRSQRKEPHTSERKSLNQPAVALAHVVAGALGLTDCIGVQCLWGLSTRDPAK